MDYSEIGDSENEEDEGPFIVLTLKSVLALIKEQSATDSQNIKNIQYNDDEFGIWKTFPRYLYLSKKTLEC